MSIIQNSRPAGGRYYLGIFLVFILAVAMFFSGLSIGGSTHFSNQSNGLFEFFTTNPNTGAATTVSERPPLDEFWRVWDLLEERFAVGTSTNLASVEERMQGAIDGLVKSYGDPYTVYMPPSDAAAFGEDISGNFSGVGMEIGIRDRLLTIISPLPDTPAEKAGLVSGDAIVKIDETSTEDMRVDEAVRLIRGEKGTIVTLEIYREGEDNFLTIPVTRDTIDIPTVKTEKVDDTYIITLHSFNAISETKMRDALMEYKASRANKLIIDVRGNPGGFLESAVAIASYFLPAGKVVVQENFGDTSLNQTFRTQDRQVQSFTSEDLVVLVNNGSASASEILAGALQDHKVATIIGTQTFGKGSVQELMQLDGGAALKVTVARWLTPNGVSISDGGLTPDILINRTPQQFLADEDPQKAAALDFLAGKEVVSESFEDHFKPKDGTGE